MAVEMLKRMDGGIQKQWVEPEDLTKRRNEGWVTDPKDIKLELKKEPEIDSDIEKLREMACAIDYKWHKTAGKPKLIKVLKEYYDNQD
jgi:hypothetical protein